MENKVHCVEDVQVSKYHKHFVYIAYDVTLKPLYIFFYICI